MLYYLKMLKISNLTKTFLEGPSNIPAVKDLSLEIKKGEVFGFLGPNGAGKTTTVRMIADLLFPTRGTITINGRPASSLAAKQIVGFVSEQPQFYHYLKAAEVVQFAGQLFGLTDSHLVEKVPRLLARVGLESAANRRVGQFSKGMHQRLAFAVALVNDPQLLLMDEPLDGLDPLGRLDFKQLILDLKKEKRTIFFSSHILADVEQLCDRVAILNQGTLLQVGQPKELIGSTKRSLEEMFVATIRQSQPQP